MGLGNIAHDALSDAEHWPLALTLCVSEPLALLVGRPSANHDMASVVDIAGLEVMEVSGASALPRTRMPTVMSVTSWNSRSAWMSSTGSS